jgi:hypothetical protein
MTHRIDNDGPHPLIAAAIRIAADGPFSPPKASKRALIDRALIDDLRHQLDRAGYADHWRDLAYDLRIQERTTP